MTGKHVSDEELARHMEPHLRRFEQKVVRRQAPGTTTTTPPAKQVNPYTADLSDEDITYLKSILEKPYLSITARSAADGLTNNESNERAERLHQLRFIEKFPVSFGKSNPTLTRLKPKGGRALGLEIKDRHPNKSAAHWFWQGEICRQLRASGFRDARPEMDGADVAYTNRSRQRIAFEVEFRPDNSARNVRRNFSNNFAHITILCRTARIRTAVKAKLKPVFSKEELGKVDVRLLSELPFVPLLLKKIRGEV